MAPTSSAWGAFLRVCFSAEEYFKYQKRKILNYEDYQTVRDECADCTEVGSSISRTTNVSFNGHSTTDTELRGITCQLISTIWTL